MGAKSGDHSSAGEPGPWGPVQEKFDEFDTTKNGLEGREFKKICTDCKLIDCKFTKNDIDGAFAKICGSKKKKIDFDQFKELCRAVADKKNCSIRDVQDAISNSEGPVYQGTKADYVSFHD